MTTATMNGNGAQRKTLASQIDRLDQILDGLDDALHGAITEALKEVVSTVVSQAVHAAVSQVLSQPELLQATLEKHAPTAIPVPTAPEPQPTLKQKLAAACQQGCEKIKELATKAKATLRQAGTVGCAAGKATGEIVSRAPSILGAVARKVWANRKPCAVAVGVGVLFGAACFLGGRTFSSIANGLSGAAVTLSAMMLPVKRLFFGSANSA